MSFFFNYLLLILLLIFLFSLYVFFFFFFLNDPPPTEISPLPLHAALPISRPPPRSSPPAQGARDPGGGPARGLAQWQARGERGPGDRGAARHPPERGQPPRRRWTGGGDRHEPRPLGREIVRGLEPGARVRRRPVPHAVDRWRRAAGPPASRS